MSGTPHIDMLRSPLGRARGLGSARAGSRHWWAQRLTALALVPLTLWFIFSVIHLSGASHQVVIDWLSAPLTLGLMLALIVATFHHLQLGVQVVIEDYVHDERIKIASVLAVRALCVLLALICIVSVLKIGL
ncbi:MAG: succinate dehydrogenase / fumarate reductase, rane anchor subunit [Acetobacteraceae bacterium]|jgi:succinate dehydrogenase / fumarate reductase membrane anchor subunit|nr:Succinate dehydrogenase rane anchor subunit [Rhodopila sp.]MEA2729567.1 succinate dehydrogenase / fumarate reductase, rane anchor subunit [Acetobacteraceae bacterium]MEA2768303.1 succinate dehydrogenase / fumarate reductase, rane anchor subunit [Acetobacteraceae bacterium]